MFLAQPKRARLLVLRERIKQAQVNPRVTMPTLDITCQPPAKPARLLVLQEHTIQTLGPRVPRLVEMLMQATMFLAQPKRARLLVLRERIKQAQVNPRVTMPMQATMFLAQPKRARLLVLQEHTIQTLGPRVPRLVEMLMRDTMYPQQVNPVKPHAVLVTIRHLPGKLPVMLLMQATMFLAQPKRARLLVLREPLAARQDRARVLTLQQDILCHLLVRRVRLHAVLVTIKHLPGKLPVMLLMQATMFLARPKRARLLVLLEPLAARPARFLAPMRCQAIMYQFRVNQAQQSV